MRPSSLEKVTLAVRNCHDRHILAGTIAVAASVSLREAEEAMEEMVLDGKLRRATPKELHRRDVVFAYVKV